MKTYKITVNGTAYDVVVEEVANDGAPVVSAPAAKAAPAPAPAPAKKAAPAGAGSVKVTAPMPGKILGVKTSVGASVKKGEVIMILEAMKMENEIVAPEDGTIASIDTSEGASVEAGDVLATLN
jgi:biotin carboxyl carrier protein